MARYQKDPLVRLKEYSTWLLGRREYSEHELRTKMQQLIHKKEMDVKDETIDEVISWLQDNNYQSDQRTAESFIRQAISEKKGPLKVKQKLFEKRLKSDLFDENNEDFDWFELCLACYQTKFRGKPTDEKEKAKHYRFLASRGFYPDHISYAMEESFLEDD